MRDAERPVPSTRSCSPPSAAPTDRTTSSPSCATSPAGAGSPTSGWRRSRATTALSADAARSPSRTRRSSPRSRRSSHAATWICRSTSATATGRPTTPRRCALCTPTATATHSDSSPARTPRTPPAGSTGRTSAWCSRRPVWPARSPSTRSASTSTTPGSSHRWSTASRPPWRASPPRATTANASRCCSPPTQCPRRWPRPPGRRRRGSRAPAAGTSSSISPPADG